MKEIKAVEFTIKSFRDYGHTSFILKDTSKALDLAHLYCDNVIIGVLAFSFLKF